MCCIREEMVYAIVVVIIVIVVVVIAIVVIAVVVMSNAGLIMVMVGYKAVD